MKIRKFIITISLSALIALAAPAASALAANYVTYNGTKVYFNTSNINRKNSYSLSIILNKLFNISKRVESEQPTKPVEPEKPAKPVEPEQPTKPVEPEKPSKPVEPQQPTKPVEPQQPSQEGYEVSSQELEMIRLVNEERQKAGVPQLKIDYELCRVARIKSEDMKSKGYFSHTSPTYGSPFDMMKSFGIKYRSAGENIAMNSSVARAHVSLMNSEGHRKNILSPNFTHIGIGIAGNTHYTQMFISK
jgi:uncharacterized YkwD family protein